MRGSGIISNAFGYCLYGFRKHQMGNRKSSCFRKSLTEHIKEKAADLCTVRTVSFTTQFIKKKSRMGDWYRE